MNYKKLIVKGITYSQSQNGAYALLLEEENSTIKLPVVIGSFEAQAISLGLENDLKPDRPLTHDLFASFISAAEFQIESVLIYKIIDGVFFSNINFRNKTTEEALVLDARTSDAIALAVRFKVPIYTTSEVLESAGILLDFATPNTPEHEEDNHREPQFSLAELERQLAEAVEKEDFDTAHRLKLEIDRRSDEIPF
ncbi:bifunctional nuclease family protein [Riemerella columbipharyngis]|uniref:BFN domain-containing protein n=1 Tax=Riemerella columbipharyngis TaxID=1071918 RepID=A0A1G6Y851_9FLAO|nr:bifunctional nuclease family protein [Riemerella columbipharyngis]SDD85887.1 hypothetical protein SAMN05421544_10146 [Riemerella columbipharyngis]